MQHAPVAGFVPGLLRGPVGWLGVGDGCGAAWCRWWGRGAAGGVGSTGGSLRGWGCGQLGLHIDPRGWQNLRAGLGLGHLVPKNSPAAAALGPGQGLAGVPWGAAPSWWLCLGQVACHGGDRVATALSLPWSRLRPAAGPRFCSHPPGTQGTLQGHQQAARCHRLHQAHPAPQLHHRAGQAAAGGLGDLWGWGGGAARLGGSSRGVPRGVTVWWQQRVWGHGAAQGTAAAWLRSVPGEDGTHEPGCPRRWCPVPGAEKRRSVMSPRAPGAPVPSPG